MKPLFQKILVANRGEIAVRVIRALRDLHIPSVAVYSEADRESLAVRLADEAYFIGPSPASESYLVQKAILEVAARSGADGIHPGYGFLSENAGFAEACKKAGITSIGPSPTSISLMGDKLRARETAQKAGVPLIPGSKGAVSTEAEATKAAASIGYPIMLKASAGGGGKGMRVVRTDEELTSAFSLTRGEAESSFGDGTLYLEKFIEGPRHIEIQVFGDRHGNVVHLGERECSLQRRHQKVIEESPSMIVDPPMRKRMGEAGVKLAAAVDYEGAGTVEFIALPSGEFYFLEMNTRLQVEHPVTELVYGVDLVREQIRVAAGEPLSWKQEDLTPSGWAIECRVYAEDPGNRFLPFLGTVQRLRLASGPGVRNDMGVYQGYEVPRFYDPMLGKIIVHGADRELARRRMLRALREVLVDGVRTNISFHRWMLGRDEFVRGDFDTGFIEQNFHGDEEVPDPERVKAAIIAAVIETHREASRFRPQTEGDSGGAWRLAGRPGASTRDR